MMSAEISTQGEISQAYSGDDDYNYIIARNFLIHFLFSLKQYIDGDSPEMKFDVANRSS